jgi:cytochrome oxidase assembly protein ShyY1
MIQRTVKGDSALEIITPLYTSIDEKTGNLQGILVNRGRIPYEYKDSGMHHTSSN